MAQSRNPINSKDSGDQASLELVDAHPGHAANATIRDCGSRVLPCGQRGCLAANNEPNGSFARQNTFVTFPPIDGLPAPHALHQPPNAPISSIEDAAERQEIIDRQMENLQPPENAADALILLHAFLSLSDKSGLHSPNAKRIQYFLAGEFVGKPSHTVVTASYELARLNQVYGIAEGV